MRGIWLVAVLILAAFAASCQTMSKEECAVADWRVIGEQDGAAGYAPQQRFAQHAKSCQKAGVAADQSTWYQGYQQGLPRYCTPLNGLEQGQAGRSYANVCPPELDAGFRSGYDLGRRYNEKKSEISGLESRIRSAEDSNRSTEGLIREGKIEAREAERLMRDNRRDIRDWNRDIGRLEGELGRIEYEMDTFRYTAASASAAVN
ncbi:uncharacterized protein DUF2799 [Hoeflea marina]|uniref:Uncharacterized protein DUF2799 n=1 Tax=Hoeflea marina TaxID=274592 RepID=A0A317PM58_9HYPH|nr:DUF2799 domain-containing protein [Hoeflea marina]PWW01826.1 uncharacterized protein DUF2799 [Hoeflea marina]